MITASDLRRLKDKHPKAAIVSYVNTSADVKAESDICCTSANAVDVVNSLEQKEVIFVPDINLAKYVMRCSNKKIIPWNGWCYVHARFTAEGMKKTKRLHPDAKVIVHPECVPDVIDLADNVCSTSGMIDYVKRSFNKEFIIATEIGLIERLKLEVPEKMFFQAMPGGICLQMKTNTLELVLESLKKEQIKVNVPEDIRVKAKEALDKMIDVD
jgi:quinolinate synthase